MVGAIGTHQQQPPPAAEQQAAITNPTAAPTADPSASGKGQATSATEQGNSVTSGMSRK
jgi:hypothetical protein